METRPASSHYLRQLAWADQNGWYKNPNGTVHAMTHILVWGIAHLSVVTDSTWFHWAAGIVIGFAIGVRLDAFMRPKEETEDNEIYDAARRDGTLRMSVAEFRQAEMLAGIAGTSVALKGSTDITKATLIAEALTLITDAVSHHMNDSEFRRFLQKQAIYYKLRPHLSRTLNYVGSGRITAGRTPDGMTRLQQILMEEIKVYEIDDGN
jgi:hypothetical protein